MDRSFAQGARATPNTMPPVSFGHVAINDSDDLQRVVSLRNRQSITVEASSITSAGVSGGAEIIGYDDTRIELTTFENVRLEGLLSPKYFIIGMYDRSGAGNTIWDKSIESGDVAWAPFGAERTAVYKSRMDVGMLQLSQDRLEQLLDRRGVSVNPFSFSKPGIIHSPSDTARNALRTLRQLRNALRTSPDLNKSNAVFDSVVDTLLSDFIDIAMAANDGTFRARETRADYSLLVRKIRAFLPQMADRVHTVNQICDRFRVSRRTLHRAFIDVVGIPPRTFLRYWRLTRARKDMLEYRCDSVIESAFRWGFYDVGRFAGYYRALFGEFPSETLARR